MTAVPMGPTKPLDEVLDPEKWVQFCSFFVASEPAPGGSKKFIPSRHPDGRLKTYWKHGKEYPQGFIVDDAKNNSQWKDAVARAARRAYKGEPVDAACIYEMTFFRIRPKSHYRTGKNSHLLRKDAPPYPITKPDKTKLERPTEDACKGIIWSDDARVVRGNAAKAYGRAVGAQIVVWRLIAEQDNSAGETEPALFPMESKNDGGQ